MNTELNQFELDAINLIIDARSLADKLESMMVIVMANKSIPAVEQPVPAKKGDIVFVKATPVTKVVKSLDFTIHQNIKELISLSGTVNWDRSVQNVAACRNYAFMKIITRSGGEIGFQYLTSKVKKTNFMRKMDAKVYEKLEVGKTYILHTTKKSGHNYWDSAIGLEFTDEEIYARAMQLSRFYAEILQSGEI